MVNCENYFGFQREPFTQDIRIADLYPLPGLEEVVNRFLHAVRLSAVAVLTGDVGSGKSTSLRYACSKLHPSEYKVIPVLANTGSVLEMYRQILLSFDQESKTNSITKMTKAIRTLILEIAGRKEKPVLVIDEAHMVRLEVFAQMHLLAQFEFDSKPVMPIILSGQKILLEKLLYYTSRPLASRVVGRSYLEGLKLKDMEGYLNHHLEIAGVRERLFSEDAVLAIHQGSGGLLRQANILARGALMAAASENCPAVTAEHVRIASTEKL